MRITRLIQRLLPDFSQSLSVGGWIICALAIASSIAVLCWPVTKHEGLEFWLFSKNHAELYVKKVELWNEHKDPNIHMSLLSNESLQQRMLASFLTDTPSADVMEVERNFVPQAFTGPIEDVGFVDLTDRLKEEGLYNQINEPSFAPWTSRGRIFGLPHDVHPMMLVYRADLFEEAGIDLAAVQTWDEFARVVRPMVKDRNGDQITDYVISIWSTGAYRDQLEALLLQAGGALFDEHDQMQVNTETNARVLATLTSWMVGPDRIAVDAPEFDPQGNKMKLDGRVLVSLMPDWLGGVWQMDMPGLSGKLKVMPLPAWEPGGRRTSVWGGTMLGLARTSDDPENSWEFAKHLYLSEELAHGLYTNSMIISPVKSYWDRAFYDKPVPYFSGQPFGRLYIQLAPDVPMRTSSPFNTYAKDRVANALYQVKEYALKNKVYTSDELMDEARKQLAIAEDLVKRQVERNVFLRSDP